ncbi:DEAD/DEAH box helicase [Latilactobacillus fuchuensis]|uniref:DEAD-box ATP-dependent RNA helicase CshB n=2 Tax=Latilactobacillus fuchuensis TaxID=164393 RepID=A0A2N9DTS2_9LACO|nr:DEAD/DEAH box helicase [Latilactobacillus fuchuensis]KRL58376.1 hypothetical protein FC69_GL000430 [Latilactobacillus fuchuensis DSM 14340 = JCM 11249]MCP8857752.1 DEAD/DEAH box helicase [Latilactobacillus fuchuensis]SPC37011.1 DEAD-box ATP-dependent RNA helicase CshB [Latilactobacillus fuchuensis]
MENQFIQFNLKPEIIEALDEIHFTKPTAVQRRVMPVINAGKSVIGQSQTGSGKTHAFLLPIFNKIVAEKDEVQAVITAPSRELAYQIYTAAEQIAKHSSVEIRIGRYVGGTDKHRQIEKLKQHQPQIIIGTPGRILDLIESKALKIYTAKILVVDEADMTLDMGFLKPVDQIASRLPEDLQMMVFSATIPDKLQPFLQKYMHNPVIEEVKNESVISPTIENWLLPTKGKAVNQTIYTLITMGHPFLVLIFANTKSRVDDIHHYLQSQGLKVAKIHGDLPPRQRKRVMKEVHNLDYQYVVATDLAARGIDIEGVSMVINAEIPTEDLEFFIHRVGRTGRNGLAGTAITLYGPEDENAVAQIENMGIKFTPKVLKDGELVTSYDRNRRKKRTASTHELDVGLKGMVKKAKLKRKPGYKKKIKEAIQKDARQKRRVEQRVELREKKRETKARNKR